MTTYTFHKDRDLDNRFDTDQVTLVVEACTLPELLESFACFLRGCGFSVRELDEVEEEERS